MRLTRIIAFAVLFAALGGPHCASAQTGQPASVSNPSAQTQPRHIRPRIRIYRQPTAWPYPRPGVVSYPGPGYVRQCTDWYAAEYRPSGTVITPQQRCWWVRG